MHLGGGLEKTLGMSFSSKESDAQTPLSHGAEEPQGARSRSWGS